MNLKPLFEMQKPLDDRIVKEKGLEGQDLLPKKILALQVELGELANEWRGFKFWSNDQEPRKFVPNPNDICESCKGQPIFYENGKIVGSCDDCDGCGVHFYSPLLEEYVDCLHFILSIGLEMGFDIETKINPFTPNSIVIEQFLDINIQIAFLTYECITTRSEETKRTYKTIFGLLLGLGEMLGFTWEQIEQAYKAKNQVNHERQSNGY